jgi:hypothetical protein
MAEDEYYEQYSNYSEPEDDIKESSEPTAWDEAWSDIKEETINSIRENY